MAYTRVLNGRLRADAACRRIVSKWYNRLGLFLSVCDSRRELSNWLRLPANNTEDINAFLIIVIHFQGVYCRM